MLDRCTVTCGRVAGTRAKMRSRARKEALAQEVRRYYNQFAEEKHLQCRSCVDNEVFDLIDMRKVKPKNYADDGCSPSRRTNKATFSEQKPQNTERFPGQAETILTTHSPASTRPGFRMSCQMAANQGWNLLHIHLETVFLQRTF